MATSEWENYFRRVTGDPAKKGQIVSSFFCRCDPKTDHHERMVARALRNMRDDCYLDDGHPMTPGYVADGGLADLLEDEARRETGL